jgi:hypothetical protein
MNTSVKYCSNRKSPNQTDNSLSDDDGLIFLDLYGVRLIGASSSLNSLGSVMNHLLVLVAMCLHLQRPMTLILTINLTYPPIAKCPSQVG